MKCKLIVSWISGGQYEKEFEINDNKLIGKTEEEVDDIIDKEANILARGTIFVHAERIMP